MILSSVKVLSVAYEHGYAVPAFNVNNLEMAQAVFKAAAESHSPVLLQTAVEEIDYAGSGTLYEIICSLGEQYAVPYAVHLDHGPSFETCMRCLRIGYTSVMFDGSGLDFEANCKETGRVVDSAHAVGVSVEGELGVLGGLDEMGAETGNTALTDPSAAEEFVRRTGVDLFAPAIGTLHGFYEGTPFLDFPRLEEISKRLQRPLVLHGGSGLPSDSVKKAIGLGISKINFSTVLRKAFLDAMYGYLNANRDDYMTMNVMAPAVTAFSEKAKELMKQCGSNGQAGRY